MSLELIGKWTLATPSGDDVSVDPTSGQLAVGPAPAKPAQARLNAYGAATGFVLQATGGKYVRWSGSAYVADLAREGDVTYFALEDAGGGSFRIVDLGSKGVAPDQFYWVGVTGPLGRIPKTGTPPATTLFGQTVVTPGLAAMLSGGPPPPPADLSWIYVGAVDLTSLMSLSQADLTGADLAGAQLGGVALTQATLSQANLAGAHLGGMTDLSGAVLDGTDLTKADLTGAVMNDVTGRKTILAGAKMRGVALNNVSLPEARMAGADLSTFGSSVVVADFTGADLTGVNFTAASVRTLTIVDADLTGAHLSNPKKNPSIDLSDCKLSALTNFTSAELERVDLRNHDLTNVVMSHANLTGSKLDNCKLIGTELSYADLTDVTLTGNIPMFGANLSNATLANANLAGARLGSISLLFSVVDDSAHAQAYAAFLQALNTDDGAGVNTTFTANGVPLTAPITVLASPSAPGRVWTVTAAGQMYTVRLQSAGGTDSLAVYQPAPAAVLTNAYMPNVVLTSANLFNVRASGAQLYGNAKLDGNVILEGAQLDSANLSGVNLKQAQLFGVNFGHSTLTGAQLDGAWLTPDANGGQASFANANLQGTSFTDAKLAAAIFTDAAVAVARAPGSADVEGVWLFSSTVPATLTAQLAAGTKQIALEAALAQWLVQGPVGEKVRAAFQKQGVTLASDALVVVQNTGPAWTVKDGATSYQVFPACNAEEGVPALGVSTSPDLAIDFTIPLGLEADLTSGPVSEPVRKAFEPHVKLGSAATVTAGTQVTDWQIVDSSSSYDVWLGLDPDCELQITARPSIPAVIAFFENHSMPLSRRTTVTTAGSGRWKIDNDSEDPFNPVTNYIRFNVSSDQSGGSLDVYGSYLRVFQIGPGGTQTFVNVAVRVTGLTEADLQPSTVCPNSNRTKVNVSNKVPFKKWMRARELPKPPFCVPDVDGNYYCPQTGAGREST